MQHHHKAHPASQQLPLSSTRLLVGHQALLQLEILGGLLATAAKPATQKAILHTQPLQASPAHTTPPGNLPGERCAARFRLAMHLRSNAEACECVKLCSCSHKQQHVHACGPGAHAASAQARMCKRHTTLQVQAPHLDRQTYSMCTVCTESKQSMHCTQQCLVPEPHMQQ